MEKSSLVILAAGKGTRFAPLTQTIPKPLIRVANTPILQHQIEAALPFIEEIIIVVGYKKEKIQEFLGNEYKNIPIKYIEQKEQLGTGDALNYIKGAVSSESFFLIYGDDIYNKELFEKVHPYTSAAIGMKVENWQNFGIFHTDENDNLKDIVEKPKTFVGDLANIGLYKLTTQIFKYLEKMHKSERNEFELTEVLTYYAQENEVKVVQVESGWIPLTYSWNVLDATNFLLKQKKSEINGTVEPWVTIKGTLILGEGSVIKSGTYIEGNFIIGKNCSIGPNSYLKGYGAIGDNTEIGLSVEITRSIIGESNDIKHMVFISDSIFGNNIKVSAGSITSNRRLDRKSVTVELNGKSVDSKKSHLGVIVGDDAKIGINTLMYAGKKIGNNAWTHPGEIVEKDKEVVQ
jgi:bifunctional UDP-N-acetylglucosamine pyrophosphorylase/glucosamine-1-phosphate N-acetyltransferase